MGFWRLCEYIGVFEVELVFNKANGRQLDFRWDKYGTKVQVSLLLWYSFNHLPRLLAEFAGFSDHRYNYYIHQIFVLNTLHAEFINQFVNP